MKLRTKMRFLALVAFIGMLIVSANWLSLTLEVGIGGSIYKSIRQSHEVLNNASALKSDIFQINTEVHAQADSGNVYSRIETIKQLAGDIDRRFSSLSKLFATTGKHAELGNTLAAWNQYKKTMMEEVLPATAKGDLLKAKYLIAVVQTEWFNSFSRDVVVMVEDIQRDVSEKEKSISDNIRSRIFLSLGITLVIIILIWIFSIFIARSITKPLKACVEFARKVAEGRLDTRLEIVGSSEIGQLSTAMNTMAADLHNMVSRVNSVSDELVAISKSIEKGTGNLVKSVLIQEHAVAESSQAVTIINASVSEVFNGINTLSSAAAETSSSTLEMAASVEEVAINAEKLGESVNEVSSSITQMAASIKEIGTSIVNLRGASSTTASSIAEMEVTNRHVEKNAMDTSAISEMVKNDAVTGKIAVDEAIAGMDAIRIASRITADVIENLSYRTKDIGTIISVIDEVAEQTDLLALNAAIIAAQAGEHGKGFAVVADEIRELAERTSSSTREIAEVIKGLQDETSRAVEAICKAEESITEGEILSRRSGTALEKIVSGVEKSSLRTAEIARAAVEQAIGSQNIREAMAKVEEMVDQIARAAIEHSLASDQIAQNVEQMKGLTGHVRISTREQSSAAGLIASSTEDVISMIAQMREACHSQVQSSTMISKATANIQSSTNSNSEAAKVIEKAVAGLSEQIDSLKNEMSVLKI